MTNAPQGGEFLESETGGITVHDTSTTFKVVCGRPITNEEAMSLAMEFNFWLCGLIK